MNIFEEIAGREGAFGLATVVQTEGSAPAQQAMKMLVGEQGRLAGTVGGGHVEASVIEAAHAARGGAAPQILEFTLDDELADEGGMICGGTVRILVDRVEGGAAWAQQAAELVRTGRRGALLATIGESVERQLLRGAAASAYVESDQARFEDALFIEPLIRPRCLIVGAGHVGRAVAQFIADLSHTQLHDQFARRHADLLAECPFELPHGNARGRCQLANRNWLREMVANVVERQRDLAHAHAYMPFDMERLDRTHHSNHAITM